VRTAAIAFVAAMVASGATMAASARTAAPVSVTLPAPAEAFPGGDEADAARRRCLACHSSDYVYMQPKLTRAQWAAEVTKMVNAYGATVPPAEVTPIVDYLLTQNGRS
jgi:cytochrome c5